MFIENGYGKTIHLRIEDYLDMTDEEWQEIIASGHGEYIENPFVDYTGIKTGKVDAVEVEDIDGTIYLEEVDEDPEIDTEDYD